MGQATSASQFFRQIGGAITASVLGTVLTLTLTQSMPAATMPPLRPVRKRWLRKARRCLPLPATDAIRPQCGPPSPRPFRGFISSNFLVVGGLVMTLFVPELPLRKTNAGPPAPAAE